ncbi:MAG: DUF3040 domain-containing protein [Micrococcales bacterium]
MGLTEHERKVLQELERGLYAEDQDFASRVRGVQQSAPVKNPASKLIAGALVSVAGISVLVAGVMLQWIWAGVIGFLVTLAGLVVASSNWSNNALGAKAAAKNQPKPKRPNSSFFEDRWDRRTGNEN